MTLTAKHAPWLALLISGGLLVGAWTFQYGLGYPPCTMCYWQRHAHKVVLVIAAIAIALSFTNKPYSRLFKGLLALAFLGSVGMAFWHVGVEYGWWEGPKTCSAGGGELGTIDMSDPLSMLDEKIKPPACSEAVWHFLGLSMAAWNAIISLIGASLMLMLSRKDKTHA